MKNQAIYKGVRISYEFSGVQSTACTISDGELAGLRDLAAPAPRGWVFPGSAQKTPQHRVSLAIFGRSPAFFKFQPRVSIGTYLPNSHSAL
jgi:hypothetical protein